MQYYIGPTSCLSPIFLAEIPFLVSWPMIQWLTVRFSRLSTPFMCSGLPFLRPVPCHVYCCGHLYRFSTTLAIIWSFSDVFDVLVRSGFACVGEGRQLVLFVSSTWALLYVVYDWFWYRCTMWLAPVAPCGCLTFDGPPFLFQDFYIMLPSSWAVSCFFVNCFGMFYPCAEVCRLTLFRIESTEYRVDSLLCCCWKTMREGWRQLTAL